MKKMIITIVFLVTVSAIHAEKNSVWYAGSIDSAFEKAKKEKKPLFLYWGAVWCPPCAEIKSQVFTKARFKELMTTVVPVYLDGDTDAAQLWADTLKVGSYPTLLLLLPNKDEVMRISGILNMDEFESIFQTAMTLKRPFIKTIETALNGKATKDEWKVLSYFSWGQMPKETFTDEERIQKKYSLLAKIPKEYKFEKSMLRSTLISDVLQNKDNKKIEEIVINVKNSAEAWMEDVFQNPEILYANRELLLYESRSVVEWIYPKSGPMRETFISKWLAAVDVVSARRDLSLDGLLWTKYPSLELYRLENSDKDPTNEFKKSVKDLIKKIDEAAKTENERRSVISSAAYFLREVGEFDYAKELLIKESKKTTTPWYYYSSLSHLAEIQKNNKKAKEWSDKAKSSAQGKATKLQWIVSDLQLSSRILDVKKKTDGEKMAALLSEYYEFAFSLSDGFSGRNKFRADRVINAIEPWRAFAPVEKILKIYAQKCNQFKNDGKVNCISHFQ